MNRTRSLSIFLALAMTVTSSLGLVGCAKKKNPQLAPDVTPVSYTTSPQRPEGANNNPVPVEDDQVSAPAAETPSGDQETATPDQGAQTDAPAVFIPEAPHPPISDDPEDADQTYNISVEVMPEAIDPWGSSESYATAIIRSCYQPLLGIKEDDQFEQRFYYAAAQSYEVSPDALTYTFHLRPEAKWSDGVPVTAKHFVDGFHHLFSPGLNAPYIEFYKDIKNGEKVAAAQLPPEKLGVSAVDDLTLKIELEEPSSTFLNACALPAASPYRKDKMDLWQGKLGKSTDTILSNGPYVMTQWTPEQITLEKNAYFYGADRVAMGPINIYHMDDFNEERDAFLQGKIDTFGFYNDEVKDLFSKNPHIQYYNRQSPSLTFLFFDCTKSNVSNPKMRKAMALCLDNDDINNKLWDGSYVGATGWIPNQVYVGNLEYRKNTPPYLSQLKKQNLDPRALFIQGMQEAGLGDDPSTITITFTTVPGGWYQDFAAYLGKAFKEKIGINLAHQSFEWDAFQKELTQGNVEMGMMGWTSELIEPYALMSIQTTLGNKVLGTNWSNQDFDSLVQKAKVTWDENERLQYYQQAEQILMDEMPVIPVEFWRDHYFFMDYLKNQDWASFGTLNFSAGYIAGKEASVKESLEIFKNTITPYLQEQDKKQEGNQEGASEEPSGDDSQTADAQETSAGTEAAESTGSDPFELVSTPTGESEASPSTEPSK